MAQCLKVLADKPDGLSLTFSLSKPMSTAVVNTVKLIVEGEN